MSISVCMITKNDGAKIRDCLESVKSLAHEIVIIDTGSHDDTLKHVMDFEKQNNIPCKVVHHVWDNNFSKAKNIALKNASCSWILMMEPHEVIKKSDAAEIRSLVMDDAYIGYYLMRALPFSHADHDVLVHLAKQSIKMKDHTFIPELRLFKNSELIKYNGVVYETIEDSLHQYGKSFMTNIRLG